MKAVISSPASPPAEEADSDRLLLVVVVLHSSHWAGGDLDKNISLLQENYLLNHRIFPPVLSWTNFISRKKNIFCLICLIQAWGWIWEGQRLIRNIVQFISLREIRRESWAGLTVIVSVINNLLWIIELFPAACLHGTACWFKMWL